MFDSDLATALPCTKVLLINTFLKSLIENVSCTWHRHRRQYVTQTSFVMKILVKLLIQDYLHIPCKKNN